MNNVELNEMLKMWNHIFDAVMKMDERLTDMLEGEEDDIDDWDAEEEGVPA
jgi:hypothetical protein